jgi:hypothetical protein
LKISHAFQHLALISEYRALRKGESHWQGHQITLTVKIMRTKQSILLLLPFQALSVQAQKNVKQVITLPLATALKGQGKF